jgi:hypothetical protein
MERDFRQGHLTIDFPVAPFDAALPILRETVRVYFANLPFLATATLVVYLPGKLITQGVCYLADIPFEGVLSYLILMASDLLLSCLVVPAIVYGLVERMRNGRKAPLGECFRWGRRQYGRTLANQLAVEITVTLWGALLVIPGVIAMVRLVFTDIVVAMEGDLQDQPLAQQATLAGTVVADLRRDAAYAAARHAGHVCGAGPHTGRHALANDLRDCRQRAGGGGSAGNRVGATDVPGHGSHASDEAKAVTLEA